MRKLTIAIAIGLCATSVIAQDESAPQPETTASSGEAGEITETRATVIETVEPKSIVLPTDTLIRVAPVEEITSKKMREGTTRDFRVAEEVRRDGVTIIPLNTPVVGTVTWRTGKGIFGKSAKFEITFTSIDLNGQTYELTGKHRQEGRGNTAAALLVSGDLRHGLRDAWHTFNRPSLEGGSETVDVKASRAHNLA
jgi:hypothetical protein